MTSDERYLKAAEAIDGVENETELRAVRDAWLMGPAWLRMQPRHQDDLVDRWKAKLRQITGFGAG